MVNGSRPGFCLKGPPPFEKIFDDHGIYLKGLLGRDVDQAIAHFRGKVASGDADEDDVNFPAQTLVNLLVQVGELEAAIDVSAKYLPGLPESALSCPSLAQLCLRAGQPGRLAELARTQKGSRDIHGGAAPINHSAHQPMAGSNCSMPRDISMIGCQRHGEADRVGSPILTPTGASCQSPLPRRTQ